MIRRKSKSQSTYSHRRSLCTVYDTHIWKKKCNCLTQLKINRYVWPFALSYNVIALFSDPWHIS